MLQFYKPNAKVTGCSCTFSFNFETKHLFASLMRQHAWDAGKRRGSFKGNKDNPLAQARAKFSLVEAAGFIDTIETNRSSSSYHSFNNEITKVGFSPYKRDDKQVGFTFTVNKEEKDDSTSKRTFLIGFNFHEARLLKEYLSAGMRLCFGFNTPSIQSVKNPTEKVKQPSSVDFGPAQADSDDEDIW